MITILGAFGKTGRVVAALARKEGQRAVRMVTRNPLRKSTEAGVEIAVAELSDSVELCRALKGARALYAIIPDNLGAPQFRVERRAMADAIARAIRQEGVPRVVVLSSSAAALGERGDNGFGADLAYFERVVLDTDAAVTILRASYFQDNVVQALPFAEREGVYQCFFHSRHASIPTIAALDVGTIASRALLEPPRATREIVDLVGPSYSTIEIADVLGDAVGRRLRILDVAREAQEVMFRNWMSPEAALAMTETLECLGSGRIPLRGNRVEHGRTRLDQVLRLALAPSPVRTPEAQP